MSARFTALLSVPFVLVAFVFLRDGGSSSPAFHAVDASDGDCEGIGTITKGPGGTQIHTLRCVRPCEDECVKSSITIPGGLQGVVCRCSTAPYQYCCQLTLLNTGVLAAVGNCSTADPECDPGNQCVAHIAFGTPENPYPAVVTNKCEFSD
jgi:hypothetical protein